MDVVDAIAGSLVFLGAELVIVQPKETKKITTSTENMAALACFCFGIY